MSCLPVSVTEFHQRQKLPGGEQQNAMSHLRVITSQHNISEPRSLAHSLSPRGPGRLDTITTHRALLTGVSARKAITAENPTYPPNNSGSTGREAGDRASWHHPCTGNADAGEDLMLVGPPFGTLVLSWAWNWLAGSATTQHSAEDLSVRDPQRES